MKIKENVEVTKVHFAAVSNDGFITIRFPYGYSKIEGKFKKGDRIDVVLNTVKKAKADKVCESCPLR